MLESPKVIQEIFKSNPEQIKFCLVPDTSTPLSDRGQGREVFELVESKLFNSLVDTKHNQGVLAVVKKPIIAELSSVLSKETAKGPVVILDDIQDPGNVGAIIRTAVAFNCKAIIYTEGTADPFGPKVVRASAGAILSIPIFPFSSLDPLKEQGYSIVVTSVNQAEDYRKLKVADKLAIVFSNEGRGVGKLFTKSADLKVTIPHNKAVDSLNVAVSAGIILSIF